MNQPLAKDFLALIAGALFPLALAPFDAWPMALLSPALLLITTHADTVRRVLLRFYLYNLGLYGTGVSWIYVSIHEYGSASPLLAGSLVALFVLAYSLVCLPQAWLFARFCRDDPLQKVLGFSGLWVLGEWFKSWFLTGFPWLLLGYAAIETPLAGLAPIAGVFGLSLVLVLAAAALAVTIVARKPRWLLVIPLVTLPAIFIDPDHWVQEERQVTVSLVQGNVDQHIKWQRASREPIVQLYLEGSETEWGRDLIIWPEAAITYFRQQAEPLLDQLDRHARSAGTTLVLGIPDRDEAGGFQNTVMALGAGEGQYIKRRLVPFGEYVPLEDYLRGVIRFFDLPMSRNQPGPPDQSPLTAGSLRLYASICYEVVYPELVRNAASAPDLLLTVSNDTWFGGSIGPWQHLQMARMRALENGRAMARATSNGITALIDHRGDVLATLPQFEMGVLRGELPVMSGVTPFHRLGSLPALGLAGLLCVLTLLWPWFRPMG